MACRLKSWKLLREQLDLTESFDGQLDAMKSQWPDPGQPPHAAHLLDMWRGQFAANAVWTRAMLHRLEAGEFIFAETGA